MSVDIAVKFEAPYWDLMEEQTKVKIPLLIAATLQYQRGMIFRKEGAYHGRQKWDPLKFRNGQILKDSGTLSKSIAPKNTGVIPARQQGTILKFNTNTVTIGTDIAYAHVHDEGMTIFPKKAGGFLYFYVPVYKNPKSKRNPKLIGSRLIAARKVTIPKRNFSDLNDLDISNLTQTIENYYVDKIL